MNPSLIIHCLGIPSSGQMIPHSNMWFRQVPMEILIASAEVLQTDDVDTHLSQCTKIEENHILNPHL